MASAFQPLFPDAFIATHWAHEYREFRGSAREEELLQRLRLPVEVPRDLLEAILALVVESDKKVAGGKVKFVCIEDLGRTRFEYLTAQEIATLAAH